MGEGGRSPWARAALRAGGEAAAGLCAVPWPGTPAEGPPASWGHGPERGKSSLWGSGWERRLLTSSRAWCAFVASASSEEPGCVLFRMFYGQRADRSQMKEGMEKQEEAIGSGLTKMSRRPGANCWRRSAKHREEAAGRGRREPAHPCAPLRTLPRGRGAACARTAVPGAAA